MHHNQMVKPSWKLTSGPGHTQGIPRKHSVKPTPPNNRMSSIKICHTSTGMTQVGVSRNSIGDDIKKTYSTAEKRIRFMPVSGQFGSVVRKAKLERQNTVSH